MRRGYVLGGFITGSVVGGFTALTTISSEPVITHRYQSSYTSDCPLEDLHMLLQNFPKVIMLVMVEMLHLPEAMKIMHEEQKLKRMAEHPNVIMRTICYNFDLCCTFAKLMYWWLYICLFATTTDGQVYNIL